MIGVQWMLEDDFTLMGVDGMEGCCLMGVEKGSKDHCLVEVNSLKNLSRS